jgi:predicted  nucleic acid-binding Zn-ribbon protein
MKDFMSRLTKVEDENIKLSSENKYVRKELEDINATVKDEFERFAKEVKNLQNTIQKQNDTIVLLASRITTQETNEVKLKLSYNLFSIYFEC